MTLKIFLLSDLHAFDSTQDEKNQPSFFDISTARPSNNPVRDLKELIARESITSDYLAFCGDLADRAFPPAITAAWNELNNIRGLLNAKSIISTVGNHDIDSRYAYNDYDAKGCLMDLSPGFPFANRSDNNEFWANHYHIFHSENNLARFIVINSSAYHGSGPESNKEFERGRISERTLHRLIKDLSSNNHRFDANIVIIHHHPQKQSELGMGDYDDLLGGYELLQSLDAGKFGPFIIIHGHKHFPKLSYAQGSSTSPIVFSCASCAAVAYPEIQNRAGNQVYELTISLNRTCSTSCYGLFRSWDWAPGRGWRKAQPSSGLPAKGGFGFRNDLGDLANRIYSAAPIGRTDWSSLEQQLPDIQYLIPSDISILTQLLNDQFNYSIELNQEGLPLLIKR